MDNAYPPFYEVSSTNHAGWVVIVTVTFLVYSVMGVVAKLVSRFQLAALKSYDWAVMLGMVFAFAQSILILRACRNGLGKHETILSSSAIELFSKDVYAAMMLQVLAHTLSKISVALFVLALNARRDIKLASYTLLVGITAWGLCGVFVLAFRCALPKPWNDSHDECLDAFTTYPGINIANIVTDIALVVLPTVMMWGVHTSFDVKLRVTGLFASRIIVPIVLIPQSVYYDQHNRSNNVTWNIVEPTIWGQIAMNLAILTACVPSLKGVIDMYLSGASMFTVPGQYTSSNNDSGVNGIRSFLPSRFGRYKTGSQI